MKPTLVIFHGAWHLPEHYDGFIEKLQSKGYETFLPRFPSSGPLLPDCALSDDVRVARDLISDLAEQSKEIVVVPHSYGGQVATEALSELSVDERKAKGLTGGVLHIIYVCAFMLRPSESVFSAGQPRPVPEPLGFREDGTCFPVLSPRQLFYADVEEAVAKNSEEMLVPQAIASLSAPISNAAWKTIPATYLECTEDEVLLPHWQRKFIHNVQNSGTRLEVETFRASHSPFLSIPNVIVSSITAIASKYE